MVISKSNNNTEVRTGHFSFPSGPGEGLSLKNKTGQVLGKRR